MIALAWPDQQRILLFICGLLDPLQLHHVEGGVGFRLGDLDAQSAGTGTQGDGHQISGARLAAALTRLIAKDQGAIGQGLCGDGAGHPWRAGP